MVLDLFCGAGGASMGYHQAWPDAEIVGIDNQPQPDYPFDFIQGDALNPPINLNDFDFIHASPPCQAFSTATPNEHEHPDYIHDVRIMLMGHKGVIENVPQAPFLSHDLRLCGSMFGLQIQRHRVFEFSFDWFVWNPPVCRHDWTEGRPWTVTGTGGGGKYGHSWKHRDLDHAKELMGMPWVTQLRGVTEAIPPAYTKWIGQHLTEGTSP